MNEEMIWNIVGYCVPFLIFIFQIIFYKKTGKKLNILGMNNQQNTENKEEVKEDMEPKNKELYMSEKLAKIVSNYSGLNNLVIPPTIIQILNSLAEASLQPIESISIDDGVQVTGGIKYTMQITVANGDPYTITFTAPAGQAGAYVQSIAITEVNNSEVNNNG